MAQESTVSRTPSTSRGHVQPLQRNMGFIAYSERQQHHNSPTSCKDTKGECNQKFKNMSAREVCRQRKEKATNAWDVLKTAANPMAAVIDAVTSSAKSDQTLINNMGLTIDTESLMSQMGKCDNQIYTNQINSISGVQPKCIKAWRVAGFTPAQIREASAGSMSNIRQSNDIPYTVSDCRVAQMLSSLSKMDASIDNMALQDVLNKASGLLAKSSSDQYTCNSLNQKMSACKYIRQSQCCNNMINASQQNILDKGCATGKWSRINQSNRASQYASCNMTTQSNVSDVIATAIVNSTTQSGENSSSGITPMFLLALLGVMLGILLLFSGVTRTFLQPRVMGGGLMLTAALMGGAATAHSALSYSSTIVSQDRTLVNAPLVTCDSAKVSVLKSGRSRLGAARKEAKANNMIKGYDFYPDEDAKSTSSVSGPRLRSDSAGLAVFFDSLNARGAIACPIDKNQACVSFVKKQRTGDSTVLTRLVTVTVCTLVVFFVGLYIFSSDTDHHTKPIKSTTNSVTESTSK